MVPDYRFDPCPTVGANCCKFVRNHPYKILGVWRKLIKQPNFKPNSTQSPESLLVTKRLNPNSVSLR